MDSSALFILEKMHFCEDVTLSAAIIRAVAVYTGIPPDRLPPFYDAIDPNAIDRLFYNRTMGQITFRYVGMKVDTTSDRKINLRDE